MLFGLHIKFVKFENIREGGGELVCFEDLVYMGKKSSYFELQGKKERCFAVHVAGIAGEHTGSPLQLGITVLVLRSVSTQKCSVLRCGILKFLQQKRAAVPLLT